MWIAIIIGIVVAAIDKISKLIVTSNMDLYENIEVIPGFFSFYYTRNDGVAFSMPVPYVVMLIITAVAIFCFIFFSRKLKWKDDKFKIIVVGMLIGGTLGNFIDRLFEADHCVIDFLSFILYYPSLENGFHFESFNFAIFNIADSFLVVGCILLIIYYLFIEPKKEKKKCE